jgi:hypothetical protein
MECLDDGYPQVKIYISEFILDRCEHTPVVYVIMHCMILLCLLIVPRLMGTGGFLIRYSNNHTK